MTTPTDIHKTRFSLGLGRFVTVIHTPIHTPPTLKSLDINSYTRAYRWVGFFRVRQ